MRFRPFHHPWLLALGSAVLLIVAFPNVNQPWCAWVALVPWLVVLRRGSVRQAVGWSYGVGFVFFLGSMRWLIHLADVAGPTAWFGWIFLGAYLAVFFAGFGWLAHASERARSPARRWLLLPSAWVALEYLRSHLLSGFGWNLLAYSQTSWPAVIQVADLTGAWGVSFLIVWVNVALADVLGQEEPLGSRRGAWRRLALSLVCLAGVVGYGIWRIPSVASGAWVRLALVQGDIPQEQKWDLDYEEAILARYEALTRDAARSHPDLIVWPETATPGTVGVDEAMTDRIVSLARSVQVPLLVGAPMVRLEDDGLRLTNSALLIESEGVISQRYDKLHLVPFGEFIPFERALPWLRDVLPPIGDFVAGEHSTVFTIPVSGFVSRVSSSHADTNNSKLETRNSKLKFSVLICFEDIFPKLARRFVRQGAVLLLNITNDAWFGPTAAAYQHAQASTFRAVELRVPVARATNTGWSGCIDPAGRWRERVQDLHGRELFVAGTITCELPLRTLQSLYGRLGDWFAWVCLMTMAWWVGAQQNTFSIKGLRKLTPLTRCRIIIPPPFGDDPLTAGRHDVGRGSSVLRSTGQAPTSRWVPPKGGGINPPPHGSTS